MWVLSPVWTKRAAEVDVFFNVFVESSKELEELRSAFARALDYMKQDVEERE